MVKIDAQGNKQWDKRFGSRDLDVLKSAVASPDGGYLLVGYTNTPLVAPDQTSPNEDRTQPILGGSDVWLVKIDAQGNKQWDKRLGGFGAEEVYDVVNAPNGDFILACLPSENGGNLIHGGDVTGTGFSTYDYWIVRIDAQGNKIWDETYGGSGQDIVRALLATPDGGVLAVGGSQSPVSGNKGTHTEGKGCWLLKLDAQGNKQWEQVYGSVLPLTAEYIYTMINNPRGGYLLGGGLSQSIAPDFPYDFWFVDIDADGKVRGEQTFGGDKNDGINNIIPGSGGAMWLVGGSNSDISRHKTANSRGGHDIWVVKLGSTVLGTKESTDLGASISLFPNPVNHGIVTIEAKNLGEQLSIKTEVMNSLGQRVQLLYLPVRQSSIKHQLDVSALAQGMYTVLLYTSVGIITKQLVKN
ncbi:T9SS type A sorting domain-containing protein [Hymenobacter qilianensis]|uniref:T9SS type A sorting domain-containing protein n=1 Tax=Hymenobacter qilianensis TaxID=1385715 RepID=A0A7H0GX44_9BACT|nr:T9SS type A sorting domain-containing protein [Hymenobacter qilianensis]QNP52860.1 T9SS type A sorting domain-containing protein [Hymenobacter qilianensis]